MTRPTTMPFDQWPVADQVMWHGLFVPGGPLDDRGPLSHLKSVTRNSRLLHYGRWLEWLYSTQRETLELPPAQRATPGRLQLWSLALSHTSAASQEMYINATVQVLKSAAPDLDWSQQKQFGTVLRRKANQSTSDRKIGRVIDSGVLLRAGLDLAGPPADCPPTNLGAAKRFRDGTMLAFLALLPMRRRAFAHLELGRSVIVTDTNIQIALTGEMTKNGRPWETSVPEALSPTLRHYITTVRPWLLNRKQKQHDILWVADNGNPYALDYLGTRMADITGRQLGIRIYPHLFRDSAATTLSRRSPENARLIRSLLGHSSHGTAEKHYIQAQAIETGREYSSMLDDLLSEED